MKKKKKGNICFKKQKLKWNTAASLLATKVKFKKKLCHSCCIQESRQMFHLLYFFVRKFISQLQDLKYTGGK